MSLHGIHSQTTGTNHSRSFLALVLTCALIGVFNPSTALSLILLQPNQSIITQSGSDLTPEAELLLKQAVVALFNSKFKEAESLALQVLETAPNSPDSWQVLGYALANLERYEKALEALEKSAGLYKDNVAPRVTKGEILLHLGRVEEAASNFVKALKSEPDNRRALENMVQIGKRTGDLKPAIAYYERAVLNQKKNDLGLKPELAGLYLSSGNASSAQKLLNPWSNLGKDTPEKVIGLLALAAAELGDAATAVHYLEARLARFESLKARLDLAKVYRGGLDFVAAERVLKVATQKYPKSIYPWFELGKTYGGEGNYAAARNAFKQGLKLAPEERSLLKGASMVEIRLGQPDAARPLAVTITKRQDATAGDHIWLGIIEEARGDSAGAIDAYKAALKLDPDSWLAHNNLASVLSDKDPQSALNHARKAAKLARGNQTVQDTLGWALFKKGDLSEALKVYRQLVTNAPDNPVSTYRHGRVLLEMGKTMEGRAELKRALSLNPQFSYADDARKRLNN